MGAPVVRGQNILSFKAAQTLSAYRVVRLSAANTVNLSDTVTSGVLGVTTQDAAGTDAAAAVCVSGTAKIQCAASISAGAIVTFQSNTTSGLIMEVGASVLNTTTTQLPFAVGRALTAGSTNSVIEVSLMLTPYRVQFA